MSGYFDDSPCSGFEGPEKRLEITFKERGQTDRPLTRGLRLINRSEWQEMCTLARCNIISATSNRFFDSYVLSESSLFVYPNMVMIKTCGTTALLQAIGKILEYGDRFNLEVAQVQYSRKNFLFPSLQPVVHQNWADEVALLDTHFDGSSYVFGSTNQDHWNLYFCDYTAEDEQEEEPAPAEPSTIETPFQSNFCLMMQGLHPEVSASFYRKDDQGDQDKMPGMDTLIDFDAAPRSRAQEETAVTDEFNFSPCGYSMNGLKGDSFYTIHVTPELHCSYASFETNASLSPKQHQELIGRILSLFRPSKATLTITSDPVHSSGDNGKSSSESSDEEEVAATPEYLKEYHIKYKTMTKMEGERNVIVVNLGTMDQARVRKPVKKTVRRARSTSRAEAVTVTSQ